jgi:hypothetical protein
MTDTTISTDPARMPDKTALDRAKRLAALEAANADWDMRERFRAIEDTNADQRGGYDY